MDRCHQLYRQALEERVAAFTEEDWKNAALRKQDHEDEDFDERLADTALPPAPVFFQVTTLHCQDGGIVGTSMSGSEVFVIHHSQISSSLTAGDLLKIIAEILCQDLCNLTLLREGQELANSTCIAIEEVSSLALREAHRSDAAVMVCRRKTGRRGYPRLAGGDLNINDVQLPQDGVIQVIKEKRWYVTTNEICWLVYTSKEVISYGAGTGAGRSGDVLQPIGYFPAAPRWRLPPGTRRWGARCDVWSTQVDLPVQKLLDEHAAKTNDRPIPRYQMIVDPNQFVDETAAGPVWVPCEFDVSSAQQVTLVGGERSHVEPQLAEEVARPILQCALPLLAQLRRPQLLLEDRRLQVVFKAQRIIVPGSTSDGADSEYVGLWHVDGHRENVAAVILYYYHVDQALRGGDMEFMGREPMDVLRSGDCGWENWEIFDRKALKEAIRPSQGTAKVANCRVPISEGTLLVFSNCQMAHRVLRMWNRSGREASRDFVALFVLDPAFGPLKPAQQVLSKGFPTARALHVAGLKPAAIQLIQEFLGHRPTRRAQRQRRAQMLRDQLRPSGEVCGGVQVFSTGNGCMTMIGWLHKLLDQDRIGLQRAEGHGWRGRKFIEGFNLAPNPDRGMSEVLSMDTEELQWRLQLQENEEPDPEIKMLDLPDGSD